MSLREKGNQQFKNNNLQKAIQCYLQYVQQDNKDNELAYTNLAMCYFKLKDYPKTIQACENALAEKKDCFKAYYRLYLTYMEIPNEQYKVFINAFLFLKYLNDENTSARTDAMKIVRDYREKFVAKKNGNQFKAEENMIEDLERFRLETLDIGKEQKPAKSIEEWQQYFLDERVHFVQKCQAISETAERQSYEEAINLAYFFSNLSNQPSEKTYIKQMIAKLKREQSERLKQEQVKEERHQAVIAHEELSDQTEENLFASEPESIHREKQPVKQENQQQQSKQAQEVKQQLVKPQPLKTFETNLAPPSLHNQESIDRKIKEFLDSASKSRDVFKDLKDNICQLLESNQQVTMKKLYLTKLHQKCKEVHLIRSSFRQSQQQQIYKLLTLNDLSELCPIYAPKCK